MSGILILQAVIFITFALVVYGALTYYRHRKAIKERYQGARVSAAPLIRKDAKDNSTKKQFLEWVSSLGKWALKDQEETFKTRMALIQAGFRNSKGPAIYFGIRALTAFFLPLPYVGAVLMKGMMSPFHLVFAFMLSGGGFYLPQYFLSLKTRRRQDQIDKALPDVLDLLIVCMEAGLSLQATLNRVAEEIQPLSKDLFNELQVTNAELRTGIPRDLALKHLGERTGVKNLKSLVALMIQSDKMGASIATSLRTHAAFVRIQRGQKAEEMAAKLPVKILFPMLFFIFPAIFIVILGPAAIQMSRSSIFH